MSDTASFSNLLHFVYDAASNPREWKNVASKVVEYFHADSFGLALRLDGGPAEWISSTSNFTPALLEQYRTYYYARDEWVLRAAKAPLGSLARTDHLISDKEMLNHEWYSDYCRPLDIFYCAGALVPLSKPQDIAVLGIHRAKGRQAFDNAEATVIETFISHLQRALDMTTPSGCALAGMLSVFAAFERDILRDRVKAGIAQVRKEGRPHGRPPTVLKHTAEIRTLFASGISKRQIAARLDISRASVRRMLPATRKPPAHGRSRAA